MKIGAETGSPASFYALLPTFTEFAGVADAGGYAPVPDDWIVCIADILQSTAAIAAGRYKDVNMVGVAVISALTNKLGVDQVPFVFGGDGATVLVPPEASGVAAEALAGVARLAGQVFALDLRTALIPVSALRARGTDVLVRKFELSPGNYLAMFSGDGLQLAETILKDPDAVRPFLSGVEAPADPDLTGFSCRWEPLPSRHGQMVSLMVRPATTSDPAALKTLMSGLRQATGSDPQAAQMPEAPVTPQALSLRTAPDTLTREARLLGGGKLRLKEVLKIILGVAAVRFSRWTGWAIGPLKPSEYMQDMLTNTDYRKFDDTLRLVLDLNEQQISGLKAFLQAEFAAGRIIYGLHQSDTALMTCLVSDMAGRQHVHFVDGADGGLSVAARAFKERQQQLQDAQAI
ncbi:DUF3095 domain-containing protein [Pannonibacter sp. Q-1]